MLGGFWDSFKSGAKQADQWVASEAAKRAGVARDRGIQKNRDFVMQKSPETVGARLTSELGKDGTWRDQMIATLSSNAGRQMAADTYAAGMNRGPAQIGQRGFRESINEGIANNRYVRRGVLPTAIGGGALLAGAGVTAGAQQLMALMEFMSAGQQQQQRVEQSPLA